MTRAVSSTEFSSLGLPAELLENLATLGFATMKPVQSACLPSVLAGRDAIVQAEPGSGKTVAFGLGVLARLTPELHVQGLVICPTRELAAQVTTELRRLARRTANVKILTLCGGEQFGAQRNSLRAGVQIVVGTPGRIDEHLRKESLSLERLRVAVLDEADRMLDMGFEPQLATILAQAPREKQTLLFSATFPSSILSSSAKYQRDPVKVSVPVQAANRSGKVMPGEATSPQQGESIAGEVHEVWCHVPARQRGRALVGWLTAKQPVSTLVFCNTRLECNEIAEHLALRGWVAAPLHAQIVQQDRAHVLRLFANGSCSVLVCTDVAARGWDIAGLSAVVNLGLPNNPEVHLHRVGRTGRSGCSGLVANFVSKEDMGRAGAVEQATGKRLQWSEPPAAPHPLPHPTAPKWATLLVAAGKDKKLRPGDFLGALTAAGGVEGTQVGGIVIEERNSYIAVERSVVKQALVRLVEGPVKKRKLKARIAGLTFRD